MAEEDKAIVEEAVRQKGQKSLVPEDMYFNRFLPNWTWPSAISAEFWRAIVRRQPLAMLARDTLISHAIGWDWKIVPRDSSMLDELRPTIKYYTRLFERGVDGFDYVTHIDGLLQDVLDTPFGGMTEIGRRDDEPGGRVVWIVPVDSGTLYPTGDNKFPVAQYYNGYGPTLFPYYSLSRIFMSPRKEILRSGWGFPPPEKIWFALDILIRGDKYYRDFLTDVPPAGILDLGDMEKDSALEWVKAYRDLLLSSPDNGFKVPVLYEHNNETKFIPFGKVPNDLMYDRMTLRYASIVAAAYGVSLTDIGIPSSSSGGEALAGTIREERRTRKTGDARVKKGLTTYFNNILPNTLEFSIIDPDEESLISRGRAALAWATASSQFVQTRSFSPEELRRQAIQDGLFTIDLPEKPPEDEFPALPQPAAPNKVKNPEQLTRPVPVSGGGQGEIRLSSVGVITPNISYLRRSVLDIANSVRPVILGMFSESDPDGYYAVSRAIDESVFGDDGMNLVSMAMKSTKLDWIGFSVGRGRQLFDDIEKGFIASSKELLEKEFESGVRSSPELSKEELSELRQKLKGIGNLKEFSYAVNVDARRFFVQNCIVLLGDALLENEDIDFGDDEVYDNAIEAVQSKLADMYTPAMDAIMEATIQKLLVN